MSTALAAPVPDKRSASPSQIEVSPKRQKTSDLTSLQGATIQRSELDSALALASLALNSPKQAHATADQNREADCSPKATDNDETRSEPAPITPCTPYKRKRVHFSAEVPAQSTSIVPTAARLVRRRRPMLVPQQRVVSMPPSYHPHHPHHRPPPTMAPPGVYRHHMMYRQWMPMQQRMPPPPPPPPQPAMVAPGHNTWICDYCNDAAFSTYHDACAHEEACKHRKHPSRFQQGRQQPEERQKAAEDEQSGDNLTSEWFSGCVALSVEPADSEWLSELNCFIRKNCIEAFSATTQDVLKTSKRGRIVFDQVGIRCKFCVHRPLKDKAVAAVSYPTSMAGIYESVKRWQRVHLPACMDVTDANQFKLDKLQHDTVWVPTTRQYWTDSARAIGMVDTNDGIRFHRDPAVPPPASWMPETNKPASSTGTASTGALTTSLQSETITDQQQPGGFICFPDDKELIPPYVFFLMRQVEPCYFTEADRFVARSKGPVGFAGFQCRHCAGHAGLGKYFPLNSKALSTNSTSQNIHAHLLKCRKSSQAVKDELVFLKTEKLKSPRLVPGWRKTFFERVWERLHGDKVNLN